MSDPRTDRWWLPIVRLGAHVLVGTLVFGIVALAAFGLECFVEWLEKMQASKMLTIPLKLAEYTLFGGDLILFLIYIVSSCKKAAKEL